MRRFASAILLLAFSLCAITAHAQTGASPIIAIPHKQQVPFSAETIDETTRVLQDGNHIKQVSHGKIFRDSEGRRRQENAPTPDSQQFQSVNIMDPVRQVLIFLYKIPKGQSIAQVNHFNRDAPPAPTQTDTDTTKPQAPQDSSEIRPCEAGPAPDSLGTKEIEGFTVVGTRQTDTIAAGEIGNEKPIVTTTDTWFSEELQEALLTETDDPQSGHHVMKLVNIQKAEPDPSLFQIPADYKIREN